MNLETIRSGSVAVLMGGTSAERDISLQSGATVLRGLEAAGFSAFKVDPASKDWMAELGRATFAFNALHGPGGEDGSMQGALQLLGIPYSGSGILGSALAMDKVRSKRVWQGAGLPTAGFVLLDADTNWQQVIDQLGVVFVKPACEGSSIGMSKAADARSLEQAYVTASAYAGAVMAEQFVDGPEFTVAMLGHRVLPSIRLETSNEFYDYAAKYESDETRYHCPSGLSSAEEAAIVELARAAFAALDCAVWGRVDLMRDAQGAFQLLEVNTIPGMTSHSLVPMAAQAVGIGIAELVTQIMQYSLAGATVWPAEATHFAEGTATVADQGSADACHLGGSQ
jgi:D-alanine-D-alanine ligase